MHAFSFGLYIYIYIYIYILYIYIYISFVLFIYLFLRNWRLNSYNEEREWFEFYPYHGNMFRMVTESSFWTPFSMRTDAGKRCRESALISQMTKPFIYFSA